MMNMFKKASKKKLRFGSGRGQIGIEELWDLSLEDLDEMAVAIDKELQAYGRESFIGTRRPAATDNQLRLDILLEVINDKLTAQEVATERAANKAKIEQIKAIMARKSDEELEGKSMEELQALVAEMS